MERWIASAKQIWRNLFWDDHGLNLPAVSFSVATAAMFALALRTVARDGLFDILQYSFGISVLLIGYGAAAGSRLRTNARFARLEARLSQLEAASRRVV